MFDIKQISIWGIVIGVSVILGIVGGVFIVEDRIEKRIEDKLKDPDVIRRIARLVRPSLTFDHHGRILTDSGAGQFIKEIVVEMGKSEPKSIRITPTEHLNSFPIIECLNYNFTFSPKRVNKSDWSFELRSPDYYVGAGSPVTNEWTFRIEIVW